MLAHDRVARSLGGSRKTLTGDHSVAIDFHRFGICLTLLLAMASPVFAVDLPINDKMVTFLQNRVGSQIGCGECTDVACESLRVAGGEFIKSLIGNDTPNSGDYVWGKLIAGFIVVNGKIDGNASDTLRAGDVIQYRNVKLSTGFSYPHHTSVIASVGVGGAPTAVFEQNFNGNRTLMKTKIDFTKMTAGWIRI